MSRGPFRQNVLHSTLCLRRRAKISRCDDIHPLRQESISGWATSRKQTLINRVDRFAGKARDLCFCVPPATKRDCENRAPAESRLFSLRKNLGPDKKFILPKRGRSAYHLLKLWKLRPHTFLAFPVSALSRGLSFSPVGCSFSAVRPSSSNNRHLMPKTSRALTWVLEWMTRSQKRR